jgi:3-hydroxymyristoyl/3-hydroxydecanoyl-(acyl carrier protein) dehydratase
VPGVLLTEMMAQAAGKCLDAADPARGKAMLVQIRKASFRKWVRPDEQVDIHAQVKSNKFHYATAMCRVEVSEDEAARAELMFSFVPLSEFAPGFRDDLVDEFLGKAARSDKVSS